MTGIHTPMTTTTDIMSVHYCSPPEYIKRANARDQRDRHTVDLKHFVAFLMPRIHTAEDIPNEELDALVAEYMDTVETRTP